MHVDEGRKQLFAEEVIRRLTNGETVRVKYDRQITDYIEMTVHQCMMNLRKNVIGVMLVSVSTDSIAATACAS